MSVVTQALPGILGPALVAGALALVVGGLARPDGSARSAGSARRARVGVALGLGTAYIAAHRLIAGGWPPIPFGDYTLAAQQWRFWTVAFSALVAVVLAAPRLPRPVGLLLNAAWFGLVLRAALDARFRHRWEPGEGLLRLALLAGAALTVLVFVDRRARRGAVLPAFECWAMASGTAVAFQLSHNSSNAQLAGALAGALGAVCVLAALRSRASLGSTGSTVVVACLAAMWVEGPTYGDVPVAAAGALAAVPLLRATVAAALRERVSPRTLVAAELLTILVVVALGAGAADWLREPLDPPYLQYPPPG